MIFRLRSIINATVLAIAIVCGQSYAQDAAVEEAPVAVAEVVVQAIDLTDGIAELEVVEVEEEFDVPLPADDNQLRLRAYAQVQAALARRVCDLTDEQQKSFAEMNDAWVDKLSKQMPANGNRGIRQPGLIAMFFGARPVVNNRQQARGSVRSQVDKHIAKLLNDEQKKALENEKKLSADFRAESTANAMLESLQDRLGMTDQQRDTIRAKLIPWAAKTRMQTLHYFSGNNYYPNIPEHYLSPHLDADQMAAYRGLQKYIFTDDNFNDGNAPIVIKQ